MCNSKVRLKQTKVLITDELFILESRPLVLYQLCKQTSSFKPPVRTYSTQEHSRIQTAELSQEVADDQEWEASFYSCLFHVSFTPAAIKHSIIKATIPERMSHLEPLPFFWPPESGLPEGSGASL
uniref:Uncharacterized protein n=1 Tax=Oreochromis niloticus TaxID=8128 RepID=A0A669BR39_ORENI